MLKKLSRLHPGSSIPHILFYEAVRRSAHAALILFFGLRARNAKNVPAEGPILIAANHESYLDPPAVSTVITHRHIDFLARAGLFTSRAFAWLISSLNSIPVAEEGGDARAIREIIRRLELGHAVLIFPEGSRSPDGRMQDFKRGVAVLVKRSNCPVIPVAIAGAYAAWSRDRASPRLFASRIRLAFGTPIPHAELMRDGPDAALDRLAAEIRVLRATLDRPASRPADHPAPSR